MLLYTTYRSLSHALSTIYQHIRVAQGGAASVTCFLFLSALNFEERAAGP